MTVQKSTFRTQKRNRLATALAMTVVVGYVGSSTGCSSTAGARIASLNPFSASQDARSIGQESNWMSGPKNMGTSIAGGAKSAATKSQATLASWFGRDAEPASDVTQADSTDPTSLAHKAEVTPEVFVANGRLWESTGNFEKAMESYAKALEKRPNDPEALANIARLHFRQNNHTKAAEYFGQAIKAAPEDAGLYNDLGLTLSKLGNHGAAAATIEQALRLSPGSSRYANNLASVKFEAGDSEGAMEVLFKNNKPAVAHFNMAYLHYKHGQQSESSRHLNQAITFESQADSDAATKRAVERSRELLVQINSQPGYPSSTGTAIAAATKPQDAAAAAIQAAQAAAAGNVKQATQTTQGMAPGTAIPGFEKAVQAASTGNTNVNFGNASFKTPTDDTSVNQTSASVEVPTATEPAAAASTNEFALPPNFQLPQ